MLESLAYAYGKAGRYEQAVAAYEKLFTSEHGWIGWEAQQPYLAAHYELARMYQAHGELGKANQSLDFLLSVWKDADQDLALLNDALHLKAEISQPH